jgi:uncharacterized membrane protein
MPRKCILKIVLKLQKEGKIMFNNSSPVQTHRKLGSYLKTKDAFWYWVIIGLTLLCAIAVFGFQAIGLKGLIRFIPGALLVLGLPGYSLTRILFPKKFLRTGNLTVDDLTFVALAIVLSIVLTSIVGLVLNYTQWGVQLDSLVLSLSILTLFLATVALFQENRHLKFLGEFENGK